MFRSNEEDVKLRFESYGPGYITRGPNIDVGIVVLPPNQDFPNHYHKNLEESFFTLEGEVSLYLNFEEHQLKPGDFFRCDPTEMHYFTNRGTIPWKAIFIKAPYDPKDGVTVDWRPGDPIPKLETT